MDIINKWIERIRGLRKWSIMILIILISTTLRIIGMLTGLEMVSLIKDVAVAFMASNAIEHARYFLSDKEKKKDD